MNTKTFNERSRQQIIMGGTVVCGLKSMKVSKRRRTFDSGEALSIDLRACLYGGGPALLVGLALFAEIPHHC